MKHITRKQKHILSFLLIGIISICFFWYLQHKDNNKGSIESDSDSFAPSSFFGSDNEEGTDEDEGEETLDADDPLNKVQTEAEEKNTSAYVVDSEVCKNECALYKDDPEALTYCQAVCGFAPSEGGSREAPESCDQREGTAKDICFRDKAVAEKNQNYCSEIIDDQLRQSCYNRLAEEYFD